MLSEPTELLTIDEAASYFKVSKKTLYYWVARNEIPYIKLGKHLRFKIQEVIAYFDARTQESKPACISKQAWVKESLPLWSLKTSDERLTSLKRS